MPHPRVTVVVPLYQTERYIAEAISSVLAQTFDDFEVIVVDDGSFDNGPTIVRRFDDARIKLITQTNRGLAGARNTGIRESCGTYIALLDADDRWHKDKLARHIALLDARPDVGLSYSASRFIDDNGNDLAITQWPSRSRTRPEDVFCRNPVGNGSAPVLRRNTLDAIAFWDQRLQRVCWFDESFRQSEDIECWTRIAATTSWKLAFVPFVLTDYRVTASGLSANTGRQFDTWRRFRAKVSAYAPILESKHGDLAEAFQLRYLARRAIKSGDGWTAIRLMKEALAMCPAIVIDEPVRTGITVAAAVLRATVPSELAERVMRTAIGARRSAPALRSGM